MPGPHLALTAQNFFQILPKPPLFQLKDIPPCFVFPDPCPKSLFSSPEALSGTARDSKISLVPSLLQGERPELSQPISRTEVSQHLELLSVPLWTLVQQLQVLLMLGPPELDAACQVGSPQSRVEGQNPPGNIPGLQGGPALGWLPLLLFPPAAFVVWK